MAVSSTVRSIEYQGDAGTTGFAFPFKIQSSDDLVVTLRDEFGATVTQSLSSDYTIDANSIGIDTGGAITFTNPPGTTETVRIERVLPYVQTARFPYNGAYLPESHEDAFDRAVMLIQQLRDAIAVVTAQAVSAAYTAAARPTASEALRGITIRVKDAGSPEYYQICLQLGDGVTYGWATIAVAPLE